HKQPLTQIFRQGFRHLRWPPRPADNMNQNSSPMGIPIDSIRSDFALEHDPEKCEAVFRKDHAQTKN
ncbi:MAG TPA: hypothetical protein VKT76_17150, partial [Bradyrhizobium sp.]|nr:hypothetical protein [Bradyrhizobium sp.]